ncbi:hypothetical protein GCM10007973_26600 [Polymorphobacter multimanifer]|uniref:DUF4136 domain-containing protein n=1 Tax=Polymorphobacter multimanifer TaxID=1070431 RepID=A0A841LCG5_9SPHN|nr:DUF4136 domain-containing protein [Polymorphobacter multimanifer]MBB6228683.1 hypothetical protein [Polymorphobacter multimanifer]GGI88916.1 hypothetical protein GCM10007973_26600 [Polymorphobacter multimanifer]
MRHVPLVLTAALFALAGCATRAPVADVTRFHLGQPIPGDSVAVVSAETGLEADATRDAIAGELARLGFRPTTGNTTAYVATWKAEQSAVEGPPKPPRFSIGLGGGGFSGGRGGGGIGVGGGVNLPVGSSRPGDTQLNTLLQVEMKRRSDNSVVWEGRASRASLAKDGNPVPGLVRAMFANFPGPSGQMVQAPAK